MATLQEIGQCLESAFGDLERKIHQSVVRSVRTMLTQATLQARVSSVGTLACDDLPSPAITPRAARSGHATKAGRCRESVFVGLQEKNPLCRVSPDADKK